MLNIAADATLEEARAQMGASRSAPPGPEQLECFAEMVEMGVANQVVRLELDGRRVPTEELPEDLADLAYTALAGLEDLLELGRSQLILDPQGGQFVFAWREAPAGQAVTDISLTQLLQGPVDRLEGSLGQLRRDLPPLQNWLVAHTSQRPRLHLQTFEAN